MGRWACPVYSFRFYLNVSSSMPVIAVMEDNDTIEEHAISIIALTKKKKHNVKD